MFSNIHTKKGDRRRPKQSHWRTSREAPPATSVVVRLEKGDIYRQVGLYTSPVSSSQADLIHLRRAPPIDSLSSPFRFRLKLCLIVSSFGSLDHLLRYLSSTHSFHLYKIVIEIVNPGLNNCA